MLKTCSQVGARTEESCEFVALASKECVQQWDTPVSKGWLLYRNIDRTDRLTRLTDCKKTNTIGEVVKLCSTRYTVLSRIFNLIITVKRHVSEWNDLLYILMDMSLKSLKMSHFTKHVLALLLVGPPLLEVLQQFSFSVWWAVAAVGHLVDRRSVGITLQLKHSEDNWQEEQKLWRLLFKMTNSSFLL